MIITEKICDGIVHCIFGEDEADETCKDMLSFPEEATIKCFENRPGYNITIQAIPCDGIPECKGELDEACEEDKEILYGTVATIILVTYGIYHYLKWKYLKWNEYQASSKFVYDDEWNFINCIDLVGDDLARLKVSQNVNIHNHILQTDFLQNSTTQTRCAQLLNAPGFFGNAKKEFDRYNK